VCSAWVRCGVVLVLVVYAGQLIEPRLAVRGLTADSMTVARAVTRTMSNQWNGRVVVDFWVYGKTYSLLIKLASPDKRGVVQVWGSRSRAAKHRPHLSSAAHIIHAIRGQHLQQQDML
jgi:hypothetical protein